MPASIDPHDLAAFHRVLQAAAELDEDDAQSIEVQRAVGHMFKRAKRLRRKEARAAARAADRAVLERTATGSADRIDDETAGILLTTPTVGDSAGDLGTPQNCYICKTPYTRVDAFYHQLCPECAAMSHTKREQRCDLTGRRALLTGGRAKIGMYIALRLLRDGADLTITTRFPADAARRFAALSDSADWLDRLHIVGIDLRDPAQVVSLADTVSERGHLDIIINNAAQTVRRSPGAYSALVAAENADVPAELASRIVTFGRASAAHPASLSQALVDHGDDATHAAALTALALRGGSASAARIADGSAIDAGGLLPDLVRTNSWVQTVEHIEPLELLEVQLCNSVAPFILLSRLRPALQASPARRRYVVNVSAMEGQFSRGYKGPGHPHTNMAKAALNMLTRTSSEELLGDGILMTAVDTGWITDERPHYTKMRLADEGFRAPLDLVDGAARVYDPIVQGENGVDLYGCFLKDYRRSPW
ncbi:SDR family NAD(P)-dependent oxidoreductase [Tsukamurella sp. 8F]|uniref:SDR family oxidoreductase n=1 Tax=unclassified Tsukamurella TaxID=2633480 RepID=UPI0023B9B3B5|nr:MULTISPECIES: SDR family oxidoreductase [unclassified Tsukamurella]MDF0530508.1 SDR family NAD(P)-dependent oxidoreductase [Tsukamurella sp. 8J]MDF0586842.1 SDR family NAD(P)-dependent oxidoreductase [Tsukamurella sp. 8F]